MTTVKSALCFIWAVYGYLYLQIEPVLDSLPHDLFLTDPIYKFFYYIVFGFLVVVHCFRVLVKAYKEFRETMKNHPWKNKK